MNTAVVYLIYMAILFALAVPLGSYISRVMNGEKNFMTPVVAPIEHTLCRFMHIDQNENMSFKRYLVSLFMFSGISLLVLFLLLLCQGFLPWNPLGIQGQSWDLAFNTAVSFITNTNWQAYAGDLQVTPFVQAVGLTVQNFVSAAAGIAVCFVLIRGFMKAKTSALGSFWNDLVRIILYVLLPLSIVTALLLSAGGVAQNFDASHTTQLVQPVAFTQDGTYLPNAVIDGNTVTVDGKTVKDAVVVTKEYAPQGLIAGQEAIKQLGTNGGGYVAANSASPIENPSPFTNMLEMLSILLIPAALCFTFGRAVKNKKQGMVIAAAMLICLTAAFWVIAANEQAASPALASNAFIDTSSVNQAGGNMEGKETRFGITDSSVWTAFTTGASNGSVNAMLDSMTPLAGLAAMLQMQTGEIIFGGVGSGLFGMLAFAILTVFISGLMVGRTPEFLGKKIEPFEMKWAVVICLASPLVILAGSGLAAMMPWIDGQLSAHGAHAFSQLLYAYSSGGGNNGSAFGGLTSDAFVNVTIGLAMLTARFLPMVGALAVGMNLGSKKRIAETAGTLSTTNGMFVFLLIFVILLISALSFFPALALGPLAEFFTFG